MNKVSVRNANNPMPTGQREIGAILLSPFEPNIMSDRIKAYLDDPQLPEHIKDPQ